MDQTVKPSGDQIARDPEAGTAGEPDRETIVDFSILTEHREVFESDDQVLDELISFFLSHSRATITSMQLAIESGDTLEVQRQAHSLKGSSLYVGASLLAAAADELMERAKSDPSISDDDLAAVEHEFERVATAFDEIQR